MVSVPPETVTLLLMVPLPPRVPPEFTVEAEAIEPGC